EVYVTQPKGFEDPHNPKHVYRVVKALYGLHQAPKACGYPKLQVVQVLLLVVLVRANDLVPAGGCTLPAGSYSFILLDWFLLVVWYYFCWSLPVHTVETVPTGSGTYYYWYALTHRPTIVLDSLVKQFWATVTVCTLEARPFDIIATIDGNEVMVTESLIRTQLQLDDVNGLYEFTLHDVLDGMRAIGYPIDGSLTFYKAKLSPQWRFLIHTLIHCMSPKSGEGVESVP
nr:ribonuclease H-like domain-containing protein [Tanacetum cinerariifolium]